MNVTRVFPKLFMFLLVLVCAGAFAQAPKSSLESIDNTVINHEHIAWPSPESVLDDLRSPNDEKRLKALKLAGLSDEQAHKSIWSQGNDGPPKVTGQVIVTPSRTQLMYASIGEDATQQAILVVNDSVQIMFAAVAIQKGNGWERVAVVSCWCKYDMNLDQDSLAEFASLHGTSETDLVKPKHYELVIHSSSGGTGVYSQTETHFRVYRNELQNVISFVSRYSNGYPTVQFERRWFTFSPVPDGTLRGVLVQAKGTVAPENFSAIQWAVRGLLDRDLQKIACSAYRWDDTTFHYEFSNELIPACQVPSK
jgi:hypothetical protein